MPRTEIEEFLTPKLSEKAYTIARMAHERRDYSSAVKGLRAAKMRDSKLLKVLEYMAEETDRAAESQLGQTRRGINTEYAHTIPPTEVALCREAYKAVDQDNQAVMGHFQFIFLGAAVTAGLVPNPYPYG